MKVYPHDLRQTGATMTAGLFGRRDYASMVLNHTKSDVTGNYDLYTYDNKKMTGIGHPQQGNLFNYQMPKC